MDLPPLNALRAFEAAGRHKSFLLASKELHVSSASISRFIKLLENHLDKTLFIRQTNGVSLTKIGEQYLVDIQPHLIAIAQINHETKKQNTKSTLTIVSIPAIAETWLVSRLWNFQQQHKDIQINLVVDDQLVVNDKLITLHPDTATIVLNYSHGNQQDTQSFAMPKDKLTLVCNPKVATTLKKPADIFNHPFLIDIDWQEDWQTWLKVAFADQDSILSQSSNANVQNSLKNSYNNQLTHTDRLKKFKPSNYLEFERYSMVLHATLAGSGVAIGHTTLLETYLNSGALVAPFDIQAVAEKQFYALTAMNNQLKPVQAFIEWFEKGDFGV